MAAGEEIDLTGLGSQIEKVNKEILELSRNMSTAENIAKQISNVDMVSKLKEAQAGLDNMGISVKDMVGSLKLGETGIIDFSAYLNKLKDDFSSIKELGVMPVTGLLESLNKIQGGLSAVKNMYDSIAYDKNRLSKLAESSKKIADERRRQAVMEENAAQRERENADYIRKHTSAYKERLKLIQQSSEAQEKLRKKLQEIQKGVKDGNVNAIQQYLKMNTSISRMNAAISIMRDKQANLNLATKKGAEEYLRYEAHIKQIQATLNRLNGQQSVFMKAFASMKDMATQVATSFGIMAGVFGATNFIRSLYKITSEFQLQQRALSAIISNAREANVLFKQMQQLAVTSPMKFMDLNRYAKQLAAFRIETRSLYDSLKMLGDISVGVGVDMDRLILAYGQVKAANYLRGQELRQFSEAGVNILGGLQQYYQEVKGISMTINEIFDSVSKRKVLFEDVDAVLHKMTQSGGAFYNMQLIQSQTLYGQMQKIGDLFQIQMNEIGSSYSGVLVGMVKFVQVLVKNLGTVVSILGSIAAAKGIATMVRKLQEGTLVSKEFSAALALCRTQATLLSKAGWKELITNIRTVTSLSAGLKAGLAGIGVGVAVFAATAIIGAKQKHQQRIKELSDEVLELNNRLKDTLEIEKDFSSATTYKEKLIAFQRLVEKAKEYGYVLQFAEKDAKNVFRINPQNIDKAFKDATEQIRYYTKQVEYYKGVFSDNKLERRLEKLNTLAGDYAIAQGAAEELYAHYVLTLENLSEKEQNIIRELMEMEVEYQKDSNAAAEKYGKDRIAYERYRVEQIAKIRKYSTEYIGYGGQTQTEYKGVYGDILKTVDDFERNYKSKLKSASDRIQKMIDDTSASLKFKGKTGASLERAIVQEFPPMIEAFKQLGDFAKEDIIKSLSEAFGVDYSTVVRTLIKYENGTSDIGDPEFKRTMEEIFGKDSVIRKEVKVKVTEIEYPRGMTNPDGSFNPFLTASAREGSAFFTETAEVIKKTLDKSTEEITNEIDSKLKSGKTVDEIKKDMDGMVESARAALNQYQKVGKGGADLASVNAQNAQSFETAADGARYYTEALRKLDVVYKKNAWDLPKIKGGGRGKSFVEEYQSMIDFVKKLNEEYERLRQNFSEDVSYDKIIKNFKESFADMPQEFKEKFGELQNIIFQSKLGTAEGEKLVKEIIEASEKLKPDEIAKLRRNVQQYIDQLEAEFNVEIKIKDDERLKAQVQKMFDDYNLTIELDKLGVDADEVGKLFNIDTKDLLTLERKLESMKEEFVGRNMEKEYRQFMRKIVEINDKANLEMAKKYVKYLREEYGERAKVELEYMRQRAEVYALPFDENETMRILDNLQKETQKKLDEIDWKSFTSSDMYIEVFEDLERVSNSAIESMLRHLEELKSSLKNLSPSDLKAITEQMQKLRDEMIKRNPFKSLADSIKEYKSATKDLKTKNLINEVLGRDADTPIKNFRKTLNKAVEAARNAQLEAQNKVNLAETLLGAGKSRDEAENWLKEHVVNWDKHYDEKGLEEVLKNIEQSRDEAAKKISNDRLQKILSGEERIGLTENEEQYLRYDQQAKNISKLLSSLKVLSENDMTFESIGNLSSDLEFAKENLKDVTDQASQLADTKKRLDDWAKAVKAMGELLGDWTQKAKESFDSIYEGLESIGVGTDTIGQAWKEFGDEMFDTISRALQMLPAMVASITTAETAINAAAGWIGLIAEAITLIMSGIKAISGLHDSYKQAEIEKLQKSLDKLEKTAEDLSEAFESSYAEEELRQLDAALIRTRELAIATLEDMKNAEEAKKKSDQAVIDDYQEQIDSLNKEMQEGIENFYEALGGFGSSANMKSTVEEWTDAWYEAFKETGDGLSGLEDSFEEFFENIVKKTLMNNIMAKYFGEDFLAGLDTILGTEGGVMGNLDALNDWINQYHELAVQADAEMQAAAQTLQNVTGVGAGLSGLQASIQGMTEDTATALEGYLNSVRMYVADNNQILRNIYTGLAIDSNSNPILSQLKIVAANTNAISSMFSDIYKGAGHDDGGAYIKVRMG